MHGGWVIEGALHPFEAMRSENDARRARDHAPFAYLIRLSGYVASENRCTTSCRTYGYILPDMARHELVEQWHLKPDLRWNPLVQRGHPRRRSTVHE